MNEKKKREREKEQFEEQAGTRTRLCLFGNMDCNFVAENCYWGRPMKETDVSMDLAPMNSKEVSSEAKHQKHLPSEKRQLHKVLISSCVCPQHFLI